MMDMNELGYFIYMDTMEKQQKKQQESIFGDADEDSEEDDEQLCRRVKD